MTFSISDPIMGPSRGTLSQALGWLDIKAGAETEYAEELWRLCKLVGFDAAILFSQAAHETADFSSHWWQARRNPAGIGITGDDAQNEASHTWANGTDAARAQIVHMLAYTSHGGEAADRTVDTFRSLDPRYDAVLIAGFDGDVTVLSDLGNGKWAADPNYAPQIAAKANAIFPNSPSGGIEPMLYQIVGLPGPGIELPVPLSHDIIGLGQPKQRPGIKRDLPGLYVQHETDDPSATAASENRYLHNGAEGRTASWHFSVDDREIWQTIPIDEVTWQSADGNGPGNMSGISCELCVYVGIDTAKARHNAEALAGGIMKALGMPATLLKRHWDMNYALADPPCPEMCDRPGSERHHCPDQMMSEGYWPTFVGNVGTIIAANPIPIPDPFPAPVVPDWWSRVVGQKWPADAKDGELLYRVCRRNEVARANAQRYVEPITAAVPKPAHSGPKVLKGETIHLERSVQIGKRLWFLEPDGHWLSSSAFDPIVKVVSRKAA